MQHVGVRRGTFHVHHVEKRLYIAEGLDKTSPV